MFSKSYDKMNTYLIDDNLSYKILILYILKNIDNDVRRIIYEKLLNFEIIEIMDQNWTELIIPEIDLYELDLYFDNT